MRAFILVACVIATLEAHATNDRGAYVLRAHNESAGFSLCLREKPSETLRRSLLLCRELAYEFCVNSSLIGSVLKSDGVTATHFMTSASDPSVRNVEKLAWLIDSAMVVLYEAFSTHYSAHSTCAHEWRAWVCSRAFKRADGHANRTLDVCPETCEKVAQTCNVAFSSIQCGGDDGEECTDFYRDSGGELCQHSGAGEALKNAQKRRSVPVFKHRRNEDEQNTPSPDSSAASNQIETLYYLGLTASLVFIGYLLTL